MIYFSSQASRLSVKSAADSQSMLGEDEDRMNKIILLAAAMCAGVLLILLPHDEPTSRSSMPGTNPVIGQPAPPFQLTDLEGREATLDEYKGKVVVLDFWATWCQPCRETMPQLEELQLQHPDDFVLLAVNYGEPEEVVAPYARAHELKARVLLDLDGRVAGAYPSTGIPTQVVIDGDGVVRHMQTGKYQGWRDDLWQEITKLKQ